MVYANDVNILGGSMRIIKKNTEALLVASKENGLEVIADKTKYMVMYRDQNAGRSQNIEIDNNSFERVEEFKYSRTILTHHSSIQGEIKCRLTSESTCCHSVQNLVSPSFLSKNIKMRIFIHSFSNLSDDRSNASAKTVPPHSAI